jgi:hypothetical protein
MTSPMGFCRDSHYQHRAETRVNRGPAEEWQWGQAGRVCPAARQEISIRVGLAREDIGTRCKSRLMDWGCVEDRIVLLIGITVLTLVEGVQR